MSKPDVSSITMSDGRTVQFTARQLSKKDILRDADGAAVGVRFDFRNGATHVLMLADVHPQIQPEMLAHGIKQKVGDEGARETVATPEDFAAACAAMIRRCIDGTAFQRQAPAFTETDLVRAIAEAMQVAADVAAAFVKGRTADERAALRIHPPIKAVLDRLAQERAGAIDPDELLRKLA